MNKAQTKYWVEGGVYTDGTFTALDPTEPPEKYGPFDTKAEADQVWLGRTRQKIDICWHKLFIVRSVPSDAAPVG
jgi:hypothetical protein